MDAGANLDTRANLDAERCANGYGNAGWTSLHKHTPSAGQRDADTGRRYFDQPAGAGPRHEHAAIATNDHAG